MQVAVIGAGYVGLTTGAGLASFGHRVRFGEIDAARVDLLRSGRVPLFEEGLPELLAAGESLISYHTSNLEAVEGCRFIFVCVPTPEGPDGRADLRFIDQVVDELGPSVDEETIFVIKSTVPPGTVAGLHKRIADLGSRASIVSHPEFLREGRAVADFLDPDRIVIGSYDPNHADAVAGLYSDVDTEIVVTDPTSAEMIKYASNSYLAARLTFANTLANLCEAIGADVLDVIRGMGFDHRIGPHFLQPGPGYGGSCFPKDTVALVAVADAAGYDFRLLRAVIAADEEQRIRLVSKVRRAVGGELKGRKVGLWGVAFKAGTDDIRESPALRVARLLQEEGAEVVAYDPQAKTDELTMVGSALEAARDADVLLVATEWPEFVEVDMSEVATVMGGNHVVDARNLLDPSAVRRAGLKYWGLGRPGV